MTGFGLASSGLVLLLGPMIDRFGIKKCAIAGTLLLIVSRIALGLTQSTPIALVLFLLAAAGSAIKSSSVLVFLKHYKKSFKVDYLVFNFAFFFAGIAYDLLKDYQYIYTLAGTVNLINLGLLYLLNAPAPPKRKSKPFNFSIFKDILLYNLMVMPVSCIFNWMNSGLPKWVLQVLGPDAPVGKIYGSLNPFIILLTLPIVRYFQRGTGGPAHLLVGSLLSAGSLFIMGIPGVSPMTLLIISIVVFTVGEAIWSPANMEYGTLICPEGEEGRYLTVSLIPNTISKMLMGYLVSYSMQTYVYSSTPNYQAPFYIVGALALITPICILLRPKLLKAS